MPHKNINALDGLRGMAAYFVVISHFCGATKFGDKHLIFGRIGVMIFFILSGFLMGYIYLSNNKRPSASDIGRYLVRRFTRVYPLFLAIVLLSFISFNVYDPRVMFKITDENLWQHFLLLEGNSVLWTIPVEFLFYFTFIPILLFSHKYKTAVIYSLIGFMALNVMLDYPDFKASGYWFGYSSFFLAGVLVSYFYKAPDTEPKQTRVHDVAFIACLAFIPILVPETFYELFLKSSALPDGSSNRQTVDFYLLFMVIFLYTCLKSKLAGHLLGNKAFRFLGSISYTVYLIHIPILRYIRIKTDIDKNLFLYFVVLIVATTVIAYLIHKFFEKPVMNKLNSIYDKKFGKPKTAAET